MKKIPPDTVFALFGGAALYGSILALLLVGNPTMPVLTALALTTALAVAAAAAAVIAVLLFTEVRS